jgi:hypothetical protein
VNDFPEMTGETTKRQKEDLTSHTGRAHGPQALQIAHETRDKQY